ncbi:MAG: hypothetical protein RIQ81_265 [Pseudomonadota bacterium]
MLSGSKTTFTYPIGRYLFGVLPGTILCIHLTGCNFPNSKMTVSIDRPAVGTCTAADCETAFEGAATLSPAAVNTDGVMRVSEGQSRDSALVIADESTLFVEGYAIVASTETCRSQEPITNPTPPTIKDIFAMGEGRWNICIAVIRDGNRQLLRSPDIIFDITAPVLTGTISVTGDHTLTPSLSWSAASDNDAAASEIKYQVRLSENPLNSISDALTLGVLREIPAGSTAVQLSGLLGGTTYHAVVIATDRAGNATMMSQVSFSTAAGAVATPVFSGVVPGTYGASVSVSITTATAGATIYYTIDGSTTPSSATPPSLLYTGTVSVSTTKTIKAIAIKTGYANSDILSGTFVIDTIAPTAPSVSGTTPTNNTTPTWSWTSGGGGNGSYRYKLDSSDFSSGATTTTSTSYTPGTALSAAVHTLYVQERDDAGNWSASGSFAITVDTNLNSWSATNTTGAPSARYYHTAVWTGAKMIIWSGNGLGTVVLNDGGQYDPVANSWTPISTSGAPAARREATAVWTGSKMIVWGGNNGVDPDFNSGGQYDPVADSWTATTTTSAPAARSRHTAVWTGSKMIVWGDLNLKTGGLYDPVANSWTATDTTSAPNARFYHTAVWTGSKMIVWGGISSDGYLNTGVKYDPVTNSWSAITTTGAPAVGRYFHTAVWTGSKMIVWGGQAAASGNSLNDGGQYDPATDSWSLVTSTNAPDARYIHTAVWTGSKMIVFGGFNPSVLNSGGQYDPVANSWIATSSTNAPAVRYLLSAIWTGSKMIVWGGHDGTNPRNDGGIYALRSDPTPNTWSATTTTNAPVARFDHTAVWTGSKMIVWGGGDPRFGSGGQYDPTSNSWTATTTVGAPAARRCHTAVWSGAKMIVWGGSPGSFANDGGQYDPVLDSWSTTSTTSAPTGRCYPSAVWTGSKMIVWGGENTLKLNTGGVYDPVANSWTAASTTGAPSARSGHTAVWSGSKMIVWGGSDTARFSDGGLYDPVGDSWTTTNSTGAPAARSAHTAVWTGSKMIVWGGYGGSSNLDTGGQYDPVANTWSATTSTGAPSACRGHTGVWTGSKMIVWGGYSTSYSNEGGQYDPFGNSWTAITLNNAPNGRVAHTAVWTGSQMIIWGGYENSNGAMNTGGVYTP